MCFLTPTSTLSDSNSLGGLYVSSDSIDLLAFEECSQTNIGALELTLKLFQVPVHSTSPHELRQRADETTTDWASRVTVHLRWTKAACIEARCPERTPTYTQLKLLAFSCNSVPIIDMASKIMIDEDLEITTFQATIELMNRAARRLTKQDPQLTMILAMRASETTLPAIDAPQRVSSPSASAPQVTGSSPSADAMDSCPEWRLLQEKLSAAVPHATTVMNGKTYYMLPADFPPISKTLRDRLGHEKRCNNCADCDPNIPSHVWNKCPFAPHRVRKSHVWPDNHSPIPITPVPPVPVADTSAPWGTPSRQL
jgi:hypothetical protein